MRIRPFSILLPLLLLAACGRFEQELTHEQVMARVKEAWFQKRWADVRDLCEKAFARADKAGNAAEAVETGDCAIEGATRTGKPEKALPVYAKLFGPYESKLGATSRFRLANNYAVTLVETGQREAGVKRLLEAIEATADAPRRQGNFTADSTRAHLVRNVARLYYDRASEPAVKAWVVEQAAWYVDYMERHRDGVSNALGTAGAMDAIAAIGKRQANPETPAWDALVQEWEPKEEVAGRHDPTWMRFCDGFATFREMCFREVKAPG